MPLMFESAHPGGMLAPELDRPARRALILAGGGMKVAFQAGVLQVWLDEMIDPETGQAVQFAHGDGASGGAFNLAMWCQGLTGQQIADRWRDYSPVRNGLSVNWGGLLRLESLLTMKKFRRVVFRRLWALDWAKIQNGRPGTFNVFAVRDQELRVVPSSEMTEDLLAAAGALPMWFPPVMSGGQRYIDAVFVTDANLEAAIAAGCNELWIVWSVSTSGRWRNGPVAQYFQILESSVNGHLRQTLSQIACSNRAHLLGQPARYPYPIRVVGLEAEVPLHYLLGLTRGGIQRAVELGVQRARTWCDEQHYALRPQPDDVLDVPASAVHPRRPDLAFSETMSGPVSYGDVPPFVAAEIGDALGDAMTLRLDVSIDDLQRFRESRAHVGRVGGLVECQILGGRLPIERGTLALLPETGPAREARLEYRLRFEDGARHRLLLIGVKTVCDGPGFDVWRDTTTLDVRVVPDDDLAPADLGDRSGILGGRLRLSALAFLHQLTTMRSRALAWPQRLRAFATFAVFFLHRLAQAYGGRAGAPTPSEQAESETNRISGRSTFTDWPIGQQPQGAPVFAHNERVVPAPLDWVRDWIVHAKLWPTFYLNSAWVRFGNRGQMVLTEGTVLRWITFGMPITSYVQLCDSCSCDEPCRCDKPIRIGWSWTGWGCHGYHIWILERCPGGTRVLTEETQRGTLPALLAPVLQWLLVRGHRYWLRQLARRAVTGPVDGRGGASRATLPMRRL